MNARLNTRPAAAAPPPARALPKGTRLHDAFEVIGAISEGSFAIVYLAQDLARQQQVVVKEYLPSMLAWRSAGSGDVVVKAPRHEEAFKAGLRNFLHEARLLTTFDHPAMVGVDRFWKARGTAFMAMPLVEGSTLRALISGRGAAPDEAELRGWLRPLLDALAALHAANCVHGDITPNNILIGAEGPRLLGFGGGRHAIGSVLRSPADVLRPGYAPIEQYAHESAGALGPWTDLYALASVVYAVLTGRAPMVATERCTADRLPPLRELVGDRFSDSLVSAVDAALVVQPGERVQSVAAFRALLNGERGAPTTRPRAAASAPARPAHLNALLYGAAAVCVMGFGALAHLSSRAPVAPRIVVPSSAPLNTPATGAGLAASTTPETTPEPGATSEATPQASETTEKVFASPPPAKIKRVATLAVPTRVARAGCSELLRHASLQTPTPAETAALKKECR